MKNKTFKVTADLYASQGQRFLNFIIDRIVTYAIVFLLFIIFFMILALMGEVEAIDTLSNSSVFEIGVSLSIYVLYYFLFENYTQKTIAKYLTKTLVVDINGNKPESSKIISRSFSRLIPLDAFSYLGNDARGWHDTIPELYVVDEKKFNQKKDNFFDFEQLGKKEDELHLMENSSE